MNHEAESHPESAVNWQSLLRGGWQDGELKACTLTLLRSGLSMCDLTRMLGHAIDEQGESERIPGDRVLWIAVISALTDGTASPTWLWDEVQWLECEAHIYDSPDLLVGWCQLQLVIHDVEFARFGVKPSDDTAGQRLADQLRGWYGDRCGSGVR